EDTGSPVVEEYAAKMPYKFTGSLEKFTIHLGDSGLGAADMRELDKGARAGAAAREQRRNTSPTPAGAGLRARAATFVGAARRVTRLRTAWRPTRSRPKPGRGSRWSARTRRA